MATKSHSSNEETEIRLATTVPAARIWQSPALARYSVSGRRWRKLLSIYWDTPDCRLHDRGLTLRVRRADEGSWIQTLKAPAQRIDTRQEYEAPLPGPRPDLMLAQRLGWRGDADVVANEPSLRPMFETRIVRTSCEVRFDDGTLAELALDRGRIIVDARRPIASERVLEIEIELLSGRASTIYELAYRLIEDLPSTRLLFASKSARGYRLMTGTPTPPRRARDIELPGKPTALLLGSCAFAESVAHVQGNVECARMGDDREGVHQLRVGIRRLRAAAGIGKQAGLPSMSDTLTDELRWLWKLLGDSRDADVFESETWPQIARELNAKHAAATRFEAYVEKRRDVLRRKLQRALDGRRFQFIMLSIARLAALQLEAAVTTKQRHGARHLARRMLSRRARRVISVGAAKVGDEQRHRLRINAKKLRYLAEIFASIYPGHGARRYLRRLSALQSSLGTLNDIAAIYRWVETAAAALSASDRAVITRMCNDHAAARVPAMMAELAAASRTFAKADPFWR